MLNFVFKFLRKALLIDWLKIYLKYRSILSIISKLNSWVIDDKILNTINTIIDTNTSGLDIKSKEKIAKKLTKEYNIIPEIQVNVSEKNGWEIKSIF